MNVDDWTYEAVEKHLEGASVREVQRYIDEHQHAELALNTIEDALKRLARAERITQDGEAWKVTKRTSKDDAMKKLFRD